MITEADILNEVIAPGEGGLAPESARSILELAFSESARMRMHGLMEKHREGEVTDEERDELEKYVRVGLFLDLIQAKARASLVSTGQDGAS